ncbi:MULTISPECIES: hypothetical protein [Novosphingobium]|uniref:HTH merR-type domain-containing protein n=1 Tax=Novosphingobium album (ex Hu et al. 2023) TaxID=2930093 RepID=A0ABT0B4Y5_9SPHN|nr:MULTISPECIES: hypothetical protein [Novosphingobium]MCJ2180141.1 hypothetical protein [Novosphingobium album (ex Hu et al. 2023)]
MIPDLDSGIMPDLEEWVRLVGSRDVLNLTGLSGDQLREWTVRRGLISPDVPASRQGQQAQFGWQTVLLLRLAVVLRMRFHVELQVHRDLFAQARDLLGGRSFPALWGHRLAIFGLERCSLLGPHEAPAADEDVILLALNAHLEALSHGFGVAEPIAQLPLFPAVGLRRSEPQVAVEGGALVRAAEGGMA